MTGEPAYSVIVPVRDEAETLRTSVPALLAASAGDAAEIVYVCNGCSDASAQVIRSLTGPEVRVAEIAQAGKAKALNAGEALVSAFPRFYLDADAILSPGSLSRLARILGDGDAEMVSPRLAFDLSGLGPAAREMAKSWLALPYARESAFLVVIGLSRDGRRRWGAFPDVLGDDIFIAAMIPPHRRRIVHGVEAVTRPPANFGGWVRTRARWRRGERDLLRMGLPPPSPPGQRRLLLRRLATPSTTAGAACFIAARLLGELCARLPRTERQSWLPQRGRPERGRPVRTLTPWGW